MGIPLADPVLLCDHGYAAHLIVNVSYPFESIRLVPILFSNPYVPLFAFVFFCCCSRLCLCPFIVYILQIANGSPTREENVQNSLRFVPCFAGWKCASYNIIL